MKIPFGSLVAFSPQTTTRIGKQQKASKSKMDARGLCGLFMGWDMHSGEQWSKRYLVLPYDQMRGVDLRRTYAKGSTNPTVMSVDVVQPMLPSDSMGKPGIDWYFPAKGMYELTNNFLNVTRMKSADDESDTDDEEILDDRWGEESIAIAKKENKQ